MLRRGSKIELSQRRRSTGTSTREILFSEKLDDILFAPKQRRPFRNSAPDITLIVTGENHEAKRNAQTEPKLAESPRIFREYRPGFVRCFCFVIRFLNSFPERSGFAFDCCDVKSESGEGQQDQASRGYDSETRNLHKSLSQPASRLCRFCRRCSLFYTLALKRSWRIYCCPVHPSRRRIM